MRSAKSAKMRQEMQRRIFVLFPWRSLAPLALLLFISGCASAVAAGHNTALDRVDLVKMTDDMAARIVADADVQSVLARGPMTVVVRPVENRMQAEILPRGPAEAFTARVRMLLARHAPDRFTWVMNRDAYYRLRGQELDGTDLGPAPEAVNPEYALTATFSSLTSEDPKRRSAYYLCVYELTDLQNRNTFWVGSYEVKKLAVKGFLD
jgi:hypothetical protein